jgi:hypothetical protein
MSGSWHIPLGIVTRKYKYAQVSFYRDMLDAIVL